MASIFSFKNIILLVSNSLYADYPPKGPCTKSLVSRVILLGGIESLKKLGLVVHLSSRGMLSGITVEVLAIVLPQCVEHLPRMCRIHPAHMYICICFIFSMQQ